MTPEARLRVEANGARVAHGAVAVPRGMPILRSNRQSAEASIGY